MVELHPSYLEQPGGSGKLQDIPVVVLQPLCEEQPGGNVLLPHGKPVVGSNTEPGQVADSIFTVTLAVTLPVLP